MAATILFISLFLLSVAVFIKRNALIDGANATRNIDDIKALAYWESMIIESKTAKEKMVYMRLADEVKAKLIRDANQAIINRDCGDIVKPIFTHSKAATNSKVEVSAQPANVVSILDRKRTGN